MYKFETTLKIRFVLMMIVLVISLIALQLSIINYRYIKENQSSQSEVFSENKK